VLSYASQVAYYDDFVGAFRPLDDSARYRMHLMLNRFLFLMSPPFDDSRLARRTSQPEVVPSCPPNILPIEPWLAVLNGCGELTYSHIDRKDGSVPTLEASVFLNGHVHEPVFADT
jgi:hypothetical protein